MNAPEVAQNTSILGTVMMPRQLTPHIRKEAPIAHDFPSERGFYEDTKTRSQRGSNPQPLP